MATTFTALRLRCGLSQQDAANFLGTRIDTVKSWDSGRRQTAAGAIQQLRDLYKKLEENALRAIELIEGKAHLGAAIELGLASDDHAARQLGLPCVGAHLALLGLVAAAVKADIEIVPRGSTVATAAAIQAREG